MKHEMIVFSNAQATNPADKPPTELSGLVDLPLSFS